MKIVFTGGGTAGHAMVGSTLISALTQEEWNTIYIGSQDGAERSIIEKQGIAKYYAIPTGKLRRYASAKNFIDPFKIMGGMIKAYSILRKESPHVLFSGGGYVSVPVVVAAWLLGIPILLRETDYTVGLANKICLKFATAVCVTFPDTAKQISRVPVSDHGMIVRPALFQKSDHTFTFSNHKLTILVMGGSQGASAINSAIRQSLDLLLSNYNIIHLCGIHNVDHTYDHVEGYQQISFLEDMASAYHRADVVLTRCGSNAICECLALGKPMICVPLTKSGSRGEQYDNAKFAVRNGNAVIVNEEELCGEGMMEAIASLMKQRKNGKMCLTPLQLHLNCMEQIAQLLTLGNHKLHHDFMENICHDRKIDFFSLNNHELSYYNELAEEYGL